MSSESFNLEAPTEPVSMFSCLKLGLSAFFKNFIPFLKMCYYPLLNIISMVLMLSPAIFVKMNFGFLWVIVGGIFFIIGLVLFFASFWKSLLGFVAISYMAKDIYENKEIQEPEKYFSYVESYSFQFLKFNLWLLVFGTIYSLMFAVVIGVLTIFSMNPVTFIFGLLAILVLSAVFFGSVIYGLTFSYIFWAYGNKDDNISIINNSIFTSFKNLLSVFVFFFILTTLIPAIFYFIVLIPLGIIYGIENLKISSSILSMVTFWFIYYFVMFVSTRYYFELIKKK